MEIIQNFGFVFLTMACVFGVFMAWGVGANDVANAMGTSVGARAITIKQAIFIAVIFEFAGAYLAGGEVTSTIRKGMIDPALLGDNPEYLIYGMMASLLAAGIWLFIATRNGWPVSTTHSIVGAIVGFASVGISIEAVNWGKVLEIVSSWVISPVIAGVLSFLLFTSVRRLIFESPDPLKASKRFVPFYIFLVAYVVSTVTLVKGLKHVGLNLTFQESLLYAFGVSIFVFAVGMFIISRVHILTSIGRPYSEVEKVFAVLMLFTACAMAFAHGSNDVANAIGPLAAINSIIASDGGVLQKSAMPPWILLLGGFGIVAGLVMYGHKVIATIGTHITHLTPSSGFAAELAAASTVIIASGNSLPVSTTHTLVGGVLGVGLARGLSALNLKVVGTIFMSWIVTLPAGALLSILFFFMFKGMFS
jgi:PiT family inorganic phosphate transporter